ncbi:hypothetical protein PhiBTCVTUL1a_19 [Burkholderia phage phiBtTUL1a]|nr:hypothetical protein PhiBTCVTUL1a_19 [Burkholderia phage phiBtTUL1a]
MLFISGAARNLPGRALLRLTSATRPRHHRADPTPRPASPQTRRMSPLDPLLPFPLHSTARKL